MKRDEKFNLINELSVAVTDKTVFDHELGNDRLEYLANTNTLKINKQQQIKDLNSDSVEKLQETEEELFARIYQQRKSQ